LTRNGSQNAGEARDLLNRAKALIDETGVKVYDAMMMQIEA
jgi:hypothetical protein